MQKLLFACILFICLHTCAQQYAESIKLEVTMNKTTNLVFPYPIVSIDRGSEQVIVQKAAANILRVKASLNIMTETNLTVVTTEGKLYSFTVNYSDSPAHLTVYLGNKNSVGIENKFIGLCEKVNKAKPNVIGLQYSSGKVMLQVLGFYVKDKVIYCKMKMENRSHIGYDIEQFHLYIRDNNITKRTAFQEIEQRPLYLSGDTTAVKAGSAKVWIVALNKFTIPDDKHLSIEILEKNGGRHLQIKVFNRHVLLAKEFN